MMNQGKSITQGDWKNLIVLDACRFDYFENLYSEYLEGDLIKAKSPVSCKNGVATSEWCKEIFKENYPEIIYISTTPHVNSKTRVNGFKASDHFGEIVDVWDWGWNEEKGTVLPEKVNEAILDESENPENKKIIAHYMQPHFPYLTLENPSRPKSKEPSEHDTFRRKIRNFLGSRVRRFIGGERTRGIMEILNMPPINPMHETLQSVGEDGLKHAYEMNLREALTAISKLRGKIQGKTIITADHGEYLGEDGFYGHSYLPDHPVLTDVPWLVLDW